MDSPHRELVMWDAFPYHEVIMFFHHFRPTPTPSQRSDAARRSAAERPWLFVSSNKHGRLLQFNQSVLSIKHPNLRMIYQIVSPLVLSSIRLFPHCTINNMHTVVHRATSHYKYGLYRFGDFHWKDKTVVRPSCFYNGAPDTGRTAPL